MADEKFRSGTFCMNPNLWGHQTSTQISKRFKSLSRSLGGEKTKNGGRFVFSSVVNRSHRNTRSNVDISSSICSEKLSLRFAGIKQSLWQLPVDLRFWIHSLRSDSVNSASHLLQHEPTARVPDEPDSLQQSSDVEWFAKGSFVFPWQQLWPPQNNLKWPSKQMQPADIRPLIKISGININRRNFLGNRKWRCMMQIPWTLPESSNPAQSATINSSFLCQWNKWNIAPFEPIIWHLAGFWRLCFG